MRLLSVCMLISKWVYFSALGSLVEWAVRIVFRRRNHGVLLLNVKVDTYVRPSLRDRLQLQHPFRDQDTFFGMHIFSL